MTVVLAKVVLACDLGGSSFRASLIDESGQVRAHVAIASPQAVSQGGHCEIEPDAWWASFLDAAAQLARQEADLFGAIAAIAICGVTRSQVLLDASGQPLRAAMTWADTRAGEVAAMLAQDQAGRHPEVAHLNAFHPVARLVWLRNHEPDVFRQIACILDPKDFLNFKLTGIRASDAISMARLLAASRPEENGSLLAAAGIPAYVLPQILGPCDRVGRVVADLPHPLAPLNGVPVFCCSNDTWAAVAGLGALQPGYAYNISGTTEVLGVLSETAACAEGLLTVDWGGLFQLGGPGLNGADTLQWLLGVLGHAPETVQMSLEALISAPRQVQPLLFLPFLQGERVPYWDPMLRGAFIGLGRQHGTADLVWAVLEGIAFLNREVLQRAESALGEKVRCMRFGGGAALNARWCQIKADICARPVEVGEADQPGSLGAAAVAWTGLGRFASLAEAQRLLVKVKRRFEPDASKATFYSHLFELFGESEKALAPISRQLAAMSCHPAAPASPDLLGN